MRARFLVRALCAARATRAKQHGLAFARPFLSAASKTLTPQTFTPPLTMANFEFQFGEPINAIGESTELPNQTVG